jgi:hypothetical protein
MTGNEDAIKTNITVLSSGGVSFQGKSVLMVGEKIEISFKVDEKYYNLEAEITRIVGNEYGCRFLNITPQDQELLSQYITKILFHPPKK